MKTRNYWYMINTTYSIWLKLWKLDKSCQQINCNDYCTGIILSAVFHCYWWCCIDYNQTRDESLTKTPTQGSICIKHLLYMLSFPLSEVADTYHENFTNNKCVRQSHCQDAQGCDPNTGRCICKHGYYLKGKACTGGWSLGGDFHGPFYLLGEGNLISWFSWVLIFKFYLKTLLIPWINFRCVSSHMGPYIRWWKIHVANVNICHHRLYSK